MSVAPSAATEIAATPAGGAAAPCYVCRCEEVEAAHVSAAIAEGARTVNDVKRRTRAGMGLCQGIFCVPTVAAQLAAEAGVPPGEIVPMTARPPVRLLPLAQLAALEE